MNTRLNGCQISCLHMKSLSGSSNTFCRHAGLVLEIKVIVFITVASFRRTGWVFLVSNILVLWCP